MVCVLSGQDKIGTSLRHAHSSDCAKPNWGIHHVESPAVTGWNILSMIQSGQSLSVAHPTSLAECEGLGAGRDHLIDSEGHQSLY